MSTEYIETHAEPEDTASNVLATLANGLPYVFVTCNLTPDGKLEIGATVGNGVKDAVYAARILAQVIAGLPPAAKDIALEVLQ